VRSFAGPCAPEIFVIGTADASDAESSMPTSAASAAAET
jgi:hypothetical protein